MKQFARGASVGALLTAALMLFAAGIPACAGDITGFVYNPLRGPATDVAIGINEIGSLGGYSQACTWAASPVGWYGMYNVPAGTYSMGFNEKDEWNRDYKFGVQVPSSGELYLERRIDYPNYVTGKYWDGTLRQEWAQSFMATGTSIISVSIDMAIEYGPNTQITIHENDPWGAQIGPARTIPTDIANPHAAYWCAGQVPTIPGNIYCAKFTAPPNGLMPFASYVKIQGGNAYPKGQTWAGGTLVDTPMKIVVGQDDDGIVTTVSTKKTKTLGAMAGSICGQTFVADGSSLLSVSILCGNTGGLLQASVHDSVGTGGAGGNMIGPAKYIKPVDWNNRSIAVWAPGEVPLQIGQQYYIKIVRPAGGNFNFYHCTSDEYAGGTAYVNGNPQIWDLSTTIACEAYPGSLDVQKIGISNIDVTRAVDGATICWSTSTTTTENYVEFGLNTPYTHTRSASGGTSHCVTLTGLKPNTLYHARCVSKASGKRDGMSRDFIFVTDPAGPNLLTDPGFESGAYGAWTQFSSSGNIGMRNYPSTGPGEFFGARAHSGNWFHGGASNGGVCNGGVYQRVAVDPTRPVKVRSWLWTWQQDQIGATKEYTISGRVGIDPTGGTSAYGFHLRWSPFCAAQDLFGDGGGSWSEVWMETMPTSDHVTVFLKAGGDAAIAWTVFGQDDTVLTQDPAPVALAKISDLDTVADGSVVTLTGKIVTAVEDQVGAAYIEEEGRYAGVRVESLAEFVVGHRVTITGYAGTKSSGERYIYGADITSDVAGDELTSLATVAKHVGDVSVNTVGLLMRIAGKITNAGAGSVYVNDGSLPGDGLKVITSELTAVPAVDSMVTISGIVQLEGANPGSAIPVLYPRTQADCNTLL